jgi:hypothetical protein
MRTVNPLATRRSAEISRAFIPRSTPVAAASKMSSMLILETWSGIIVSLYRAVQAAILVEIRMVLIAQVISRPEQNPKCVAN